MRRSPPAHPPGLLPRAAVAAPTWSGAGIGAVTMMRLLNICVIVALVLAAADVYKIKFESTRQAQRVAKLRMEIRREHDAIAALRAEWAKLDNPGRIQESGAAAPSPQAGGSAADRPARQSAGASRPTSCRRRSPIRSGR